MPEELRPNPVPLFIHDDVLKELAQAKSALIKELRSRKHDRPIDRALSLMAAAEIERLREALELIRDNGGTYTPEEGMTCNGSWCAEQARRALEETK